MNLIPVLKPKLPKKNKITPYLEQIDEARWYSNFGPLLIQFENRLAKHFQIENEMITTGANGTLLLVSILRSLNLPEKALCIMPSWTFTATPAAAMVAGLEPYFVDVDKTTQTFDPQQVKNKLSQLNKPVAAVIVVAPFGAPIDSKSWDVFSEETGIPVIIDAAAAFDAVSTTPSMRVGKSVTMISLHATKALGIGEGGLALSTNAKLINNIKHHTGFGFAGTRESMVVGYNAKLSEYAAAVGLAALDEWEETRKQWVRVRDDYQNELKTTVIDVWLGKEWVASTCNIIIPKKADNLAEYLKEKGIQTQKWWSNGCHPQTAYRQVPREEKLENTQWLAQSVLGLPFAVDLSSAQVKEICDAIKAYSELEVMEEVL